MLLRQHLSVTRNLIMLIGGSHLGLGFSVLRSRLSLVIGLSLGERFFRLRLLLPGIASRYFAGAVVHFFLARSFRLGLVDLFASLLLGFDWR